MQWRDLGSRLRRFSLLIWGMLILVILCPVQSFPEKGYRLLADGIVVDRPVHWQQWTYPRHAMEIDSATQKLRPRYLRQPIDAIENLAQFRIKIGDRKVYDRLLRTFQRENRSLPLNIGTAPARVAGQPVVHLEGDPKTGVRKGDPVIWYYYHAGIRQAPNNPATASHILDGDFDTYWGPTTEIGEEAYNALPQAEKGPVYYFVQTATGQEERVERAVYDPAPETRRRVQYHSRSLKDWYVEVDLGRVVPVSRIVLQFVEEGMGEPFRQCRLLATPSHDPDASWSLIGRTTHPNEDRRVVSFDLDPDDEGSYEQIQRLRIVVTDSKLDKFKKVSEETYWSLPEDRRGGIDYYVLTALGGEIQRDEETYHRVGPERQGRRVYYQRERPRLADIEVWCQGGNLGLGFIDGGGSAEMVGPYTPLELGFDGVYDTSYFQTYHFSANEVSNSDYWNRGLLTLDLGAVFWLDQLRTLGCCKGGELNVRISDGARSPSGELKWTEIPGTLGESGLSYKTAMDIWEGRIIVGDFEKELSPPARARFVQTDLYHKKAGPSVGGGFQVGEYQLFGTGFPAEIVLTSPLIELPGPVVLRDIRWEAEIPEPHLTGVEIRTRTGDRLLEQTRYYTRSGEEVQDAVYQKLPHTLRGPVVTHQIPGSGWSPWSSPYRRSGESVLSPSPRKYLQIQVKLHSDSPELAPGIHSLHVGFQPPVAHQVRAEIWPNQVPLGVPQTFTCYLNPTFVAARPDGSPSTRFDELRLDATPIEAIRLVDVSLGSETAFRQDTPQAFQEISWQVDPISGTRTPWFIDETGRRFQALIDPESGDTLKVWEGAVAGLEEVTGGPILQLQFSRKIALLPEGEEERVYNRVIRDERDQVPVDEDGRRLNEILYLNLPAEQRGRRLYLALTGRKADGTAIQDSASKGEYWALPDSLRGEIRYFRTGIGGEFPFDRAGERLTEEAYERLDPEEQGAVLAAGQLVRVRFQGEVVLHGTTIDAAIRDARTSAVWQPVDAGEATALTPGSGLSIAVPFNRRILHHVTVAPNPFTPNGDGINDRTEIRFDLGKLNQTRKIQVAIYDLSGRRVWQQKQEGYGSPVFVWDGRDNTDEWVPPGLYVCKVNVRVDADEATRTTAARVIAVAY